MPRIDVDPHLRPPYRRRSLMRGGEVVGLWTYESENPVGHRDADGTEFAEVSFTIRLPAGHTPKRVTLLSSEVDQLLELGEVDLDAVKAIVARRPATEGPQ